MTYARRGMGWVYFVKPTGWNGPIKIGHSQQPPLRLASLRSWSPLPLELIAVFKAEPIVEARIHALLKADVSHGEWFHPTQAVLDVIASVKNETLDVQALPEPFDLRSLARKPGGSDGLGPLSGSFTAAFDRLKRRGVVAPTDVKEAAERFNNNPYRVGWGKERDPADALLVATFLSENDALSDYAFRKMAEIGHPVLVSRRAA